VSGQRHGEYVREEKEQQQQINQLKKTLNDLKKRVEAQERQGK
jgi:ABC-type Fe3+-citrate transport system substrate-binding protein